MSFIFFLFLDLAAILFSGAERFSNCCRRSSNKRSCGIILKSGDWSTRISCLKIFLFLSLAAILLSKGK